MCSCNQLCALVNNLITHSGGIDINGDDGKVLTQYFPNSLGTLPGGAPALLCICKILPQAHLIQLNEPFIS